MAGVDDTWRREGRFWIPGDDDKAFGWVDYSPDRGIAVHLLESPFPGGAMEVVRVEALHGESLDDWPFSLLDGERVAPQTITPSNARTADLMFDTFVQGPHVTALDQVTGTMAHVGLHGLRELVRGGGFGAPLLSVSADRECTEHCAVEMTWGSLQLFARGVQTKWSRDETRIAVRAHAQLAFDDEVPLSVVDSTVEPLRDLIAFATGRPSFVTSLALYGAKDERSAPWQQRREFNVIRRPEGEPARVRRSRLPLLLNPATLPQGAGIIGRWFAMREVLGPVWRLFFSTVVDPSLTPESQLLNLTAFAEGYHRTLHDAPPLPEEDAVAAVRSMLDVLPDNRHREVFRGVLTHANSESQRARVRWLAKRAVAVLETWDLDVREFTSQVTDTRNWLTHWGDRGDHAQEAEDLSTLASRLYLVLSVNILLDLGLDAEDASSQLATRLRVLGLP